MIVILEYMGFFIFFLHYNQDTDLAVASKSLHNPRI